MKYVDLAGAQYLVEKLQTAIQITRTVYNYTTESAETVTFTVPAFTTDGKSTIDIYVNRLWAIPQVDYTITDNVVTLTKELTAGQNISFVVNTIKL